MYMHLGCEGNMVNELVLELDRRERTTWGAFRIVEELVKKAGKLRLGVHLFDPAAPVLTYTRRPGAYEGRMSTQSALCGVQSRGHC